MLLPLVCMQTYSATFEAVAESPMPVRQRTLSFELQGEGNLPQVSVVRPSLRDGTSGKLMMVFKRLLAGLTSSAPLVLRNTGTIPAHITVEVLHGGQSFSVDPRGSSAEVLCEDGDHITSSLPLVSSEIEAGGTGEFLVGFSPQQVGRHTGELQLRIRDNHFENTTVLLIGESYQDDITIENMRALGFDVAAIGSEEDQQSQSSGKSVVGQAGALRVLALAVLRPLPLLLRLTASSSSPCVLGCSAVASVWCFFSCSV